LTGVKSATNVVKQGRSGGYVLQPVADEVEVVHGGDTETPTPS
jgi:hypothetical protein